MILSKHLTKNTNKNGYYCICKCDFCGKRFIRKASEAERGKFQFCDQKCFGKWSKDHNGNWKGGRIKHCGGYIYIRKKEYPCFNKNGYVFEHRLIMEKYLGRYLTSDETIHHINGIKDDNRLENLEIFSTSHPVGQRVKDKIRWAKEILEKYKDIVFQ